MLHRAFWTTCLSLLTVGLFGAVAPPPPPYSVIERNEAVYTELARRIGALAELGYQEHESSKLLQEHLKNAGFHVTTGVAGLPTAFTASFGTGPPVIGILGEFDALPDMSQTASPYRDAVPGQSAGHACGHHLFGVGSAAAAVAVKEWLASGSHSGTIRYYGTPAEEGGSGKVYMVRAGLFDDVDAVLHWHPSDVNSADPASSLANKSAKFRFRGIAAHASAAPERGRSALDGVEAMNYMTNLLREHVPSETRIHYVITHGGGAPNVVPDFAEVYYYCRHPDRETVQAIWERIEQAARGAAQGTGTSVDWEIMHGNYELLPNVILSGRLHSHLSSVGGVRYDQEEQTFAHAISRTFARESDPETLLQSAKKVRPFVPDPPRTPTSTDVGDVSWVVPTAGLRTATWVPGTAPHSWQAVAAGGTSIGIKGTTVAAKTLTLSAVELFLQPDLLVSAKAEFRKRRGESFEYEPLLGDRAPPLDYRK